MLSLLLYALTVKAQTGSIEITIVEFDCTINGELGMKIHSHVNINDWKDKEVQYIIFFYKESNGAGGKLYSTGKSTAADGHVCCYTNGTPDYVNCEWKDWWIFIPYDHFPHNAGENHYSMMAEVRKTGEYNWQKIASSAYYNFHVSYGAASTQNQNTNTTSNQSQNKSKSTGDLSVNRSFTNGAGSIENLNKANTKFATPAYGTMPQGNYFYLCKDGTNCVVKVIVTEKDGNIMAITYDTHYAIGNEYFKYWPNKNTADYFYFYGVMPINWNSHGYGMDLYIAKDWSHVIMTTNYGSIFDRQCSEREYIKSHMEYKPTKMGFTYDNDTRRYNASQQHLNQMQQEIQAEIRALEKGSGSSSNSSSSYNSNNRSSVRVKQYSPNYTGSSEQVWCNECNAWDYPHIHVNKTY